MAILTPLNDFVLLQPDVPKSYAEYRKFSHIVVPDQWEHGPEDRPVWGKIVAKGKDCRTEIEVGQRIVIGKWAGARVKYDEVEYILVKGDDILAKDGSA